MTSEMAQRVWARIDRYKAGDTDAITGQDALGEVHALVRSMEIDAVNAVAWLYWHRAEAFGDTERGRGEREQAEQLFWLVYQSDPDKVPASLRAVLQERRVARQDRMVNASPAPYGRQSAELLEDVARANADAQAYVARGDHAALDSALTRLQRWRDQLAPGDPARIYLDMSVGGGALTMYERSGDPELLKKAVPHLREGLARLSDDHDTRPSAMNAVAMALLHQYLDGANPSGFDDLMTAVPEVGRIMRMLDRARESEDIPAAIAEVVAAARAEVGAAGRPKDIVDVRTEIGAAGRTEIGAAGRAEDVGAARPENVVDVDVDVDGAEGGAVGRAEEVANVRAEDVGAARARTDTGPQGGSDRDLAILGLGTALLAQFEATHDDTALEEAIGLLGEVSPAVAASGQVSAMRGFLSAALAEHRSDPDLVHQGLEQYAEGVRDINPGHPEYLPFAITHVRSLLAAYAVTGDLARLDQAIAEARDVLGRLPADSAIRPAAMILLANALGDRNDHLGDRVALAEAVRLLTQCLEQPESRFWVRYEVLQNLATKLIAAGQGDKAAVLARKALRELPQGHAARFITTVTLAQALSVVTRPGAAGEAVAILRAAVAGATGHEFAYASNALALALLRQGGGPRAYDEAIVVLQRAAAAGEQLDRGINVGLLGQVRYERARDAWNGDVRRNDDVRPNGDIRRKDDVRPNGGVRRNDDDVRLNGDDVRLNGDDVRRNGELALAAAEIRASLTYQKSPPQLVTAQTALGWIAADLGDWDGACAEFEVAIRTLPQVTPLRLARADRESRLTMMRGFAADAAACALEADRPRQAVQFLERARGLLLAQALGIDSGLDELRAVNPDAATRLAALRDRMNAPGTSTEAMRKLAEQWDVLAAETGWRSDVDDLPFSTSEGPLIYVNLSRYRCAAIAVTEGGLEVVPLSASAYAEAHDHAARLDAADPETIALARRWLWDAIAAPVLDRLGFGPRTDDVAAWPRVWWCPTAVLTGLPLHAAGDDDRPGNSVGDRVVSSYAPTARALAHARARRRSAPMTGENLFVAAMSATPDARPLRGAAAEKDWLKGRFPGAHVLFNEQVTYDRVVAALPGRTIAHFACHAVADRRAPSASRILFDDHETRPMTLPRLAALRLPAPALAYLSMCESLRPAEGLEDEAAHLAAGFLMAGFPQVVATMWEVEDAFSAGLATRFYTLIADQDLAVVSVAHALHQAVRDTAAELDAAPHVWAPFIHVGA
ncbi:CHAT domain-containing protein [Streptosporangiaceae bacterium NEAU-GS5]|nr:CHAT domain-containing protein [Streptosporangiaceae bacterium NEAU-GS5]